MKSSGLSGRAQPPTGREHIAPIQITSTSATERAVFRKCRRQWLLGVVHRLEPNDGNPNLWFGTLFHAALEAYYLAIMAGRSHEEAGDAAFDAYQATYDTSLDPVREQLGFLWSTAEPLFRDMGEMGIEMLQAYLDREVQDPIGERVIAVELRVNVPIRTPGGRKVGVLSVRTDLVVTRDGQVAVVDHKTASRAPDSAHLDIDDQLTAEVYSWWKHSGDFPEEAVYNVALKRIAKPPRLIKKGRALSQDRTQSTTHALYLEAIRENGFAVGEYADMLVYLVEQESEGGQFFRREVTFRTPAQMAAFERDLYQEWRDMRAVASHPERAYPSPSSLNCRSCPVRSICVTIQEDGDVEAVAKAGYVVAEPRR